MKKPILLLMIFCSICLKSSVSAQQPRFEFESAGFHFSDDSLSNRKIKSSRYKVAEQWRQDLKRLLDLTENESVNWTYKLMVAEWKFIKDAPEFTASCALSGMFGSKPDSIHVFAMLPGESITVVSLNHYFNSTLVLSPYVDSLGWFFSSLITVSSTLESLAYLRGYDPSEIDSIVKSTRSQIYNETIFAVYKSKEFQDFMNSLVSQANLRPDAKHNVIKTYFSSYFSVDDDDILENLALVMEEMYKIESEQNPLPQKL
ncbi:MAG: hypothetical protein KBC67_01025 [Candidatus Pacebacteria bacterium]|nr:hypothetical protein [Candidatus Paceibacterota bacterium]